MQIELMEEIHKQNLHFIVGISLIYTAMQNNTQGLLQK